MIRSGAIWALTIMNRDKKRGEREWVGRFRATWKGGCDITSVHTFERPDFRGWLASGRQYGLEVTTVTDKVLAESTSRLQAFRDELENAAREAAVSAVFSLDFEEYHAARLVDREHRRQLVAGLLTLARAANARPTQRHRTVTLDGLDGVRIYPEEKGVAVVIGRGAWGRGWNEIQACIGAKNAKIEEYRKRIPDDALLWLLLVAGNTFASGVAAPSPNLPFESSFDRIFFLDTSRYSAGQRVSKVVELLIKRDLK